ncbi:MAG: hypothetical protein INF91_12520 [Alphaproteobacteria bacterium]|nr:hypothetical protein [Alphaproteobacteria bacterium]
MNPFEMVVLIVAIVVLGRVITARVRHGGPKADAGLAAENDRMKREMAQLKDRIATLERIATDAPARLSSEIERLRDEKTN